MVATVTYFNQFLSRGELDLQKIKAHSNFLRIALPFLSAPTPKELTFSSLTEAIKELPEVITLADGSTMSRVVYFKLLHMLGSKSRSDYLEGSQGKNPSLSAAVPLVLWSYKENKGIKYEDWDWSDLPLGVMSAFLGKALECILEYVHVDMSMYDLPTLREEAMISKNDTKLNTKSIYMANTSDGNFNSLPKNVKFMMLQWWIWNPSIRHESMIMDLMNLDNKPEPMEVSRVSEVVIDIPWM